MPKESIGIKVSGSIAALKVDRQLVGKTFDAVSKGEQRCLSQRLLIEDSEGLEREEDESEPGTNVNSFMADKNVIQSNCYNFLINS